MYYLQVTSGLEDVISHNFLLCVNYIDGIFHTYYSARLNVLNVPHKLSLEGCCYSLSFLCDV